MRSRVFLCAQVNACLNVYLDEVAACVGQYSHVHLPGVTDSVAAERSSDASTVTAMCTAARARYAPVGFRRTVVKDADSEPIGPGDTNVSPLSRVTTASGVGVEAGVRRSGSFFSTAHSEGRAGTARCLRRWPVWWLLTPRDCGCWLRRCTRPCDV